MSQNKNQIHEFKDAEITEQPGIVPVWLYIV